MATPINTGTQAAFDNFYGFAPKKGPRSLAQSIDFGIANPYYIDFVSAVQADKLEWIESIYVDNSLNPAPLKFVFAQSEQSIIVPANAQAYLPVLCPNDPGFTLSTTGTPIVKIHFLNFAVPAAVWNTNTSYSGSKGTDYSVNKPTAAANLLLTIPVNLNRNQVEIQNQDANDIQLRLDDGASANETWIILAQAAVANAQGGAWVSNNFKGRIRIYSTNATAQVAAHEL